MVQPSEFDETVMGLSPSASVPDSEYLLIRSTTEAALAANARTECAAAAHRAIAQSYLTRLFDRQSNNSFDVTDANRTTLTSLKAAARTLDVRLVACTPAPENGELTRLLADLL